MTNPKHLITLFSVTALATGCTTTPERWGEARAHKMSHPVKGDAERIAKHNSPDPKVASGAHVRTGAQVASYDVGRTVRPDGTMVEAHRVYKIYQDAHWNLGLPKGSAQASTGPGVPTLPSNAVPVDEQHLRDLKADVDRFKEDQTKRVNAALANDNNLRGELKDQVEANQKQVEMIKVLQQQVDAAMGTPSHPPEEASSPAPRSASTPVKDPLAEYQKRVSKGQQ